jgi:hypothetical protein
MRFIFVGLSQKEILPFKIKETEPRDIFAALSLAFLTKSFESISFRLQKYVQNVGDCIEIWF